jgi:hypothetical protein
MTRPDVEGMRGRNAEPMGKDAKVLLLQLLTAARDCRALLAYVAELEAAIGAECEGCYCRDGCAEADCPFYPYREAKP